MHTYNYYTYAKNNKARSEANIWVESLYYKNFLQRSIGIINSKKSQNQ